MHAGRQILFWIAPWVFRQLVDITAGFPAIGRRSGSRLLDQRLQALLSGRITLVIETVQLEALHQRGYILLGSDDARIIGSTHELGHHQGGENAHDGHHHHDFNQSEAARGQAAARTKMVKLRKHMHRAHSKYKKRNASIKRSRTITRLPYGTKLI